MDETKPAPVPVPATTSTTAAAVETQFAKAVAFIEGRVYVRLWVLVVIAVGGIIIGKLI